jgi:hypothetical protein
MGPRATVTNKRSKSKEPRLFDYLVGAGERCWPHFVPGRQCDDQIVMNRPGSVAYLRNP